MNIDKLKPEEVNAVIARWDAQTDTLRGWSSPADMDCRCDKLDNYGQNHVD